MCGEHEKAVNTWKEECDWLEAAGTLVKNLQKKPKHVLKVTLEKELELGDVSDNESVADKD